MTTTTDSLFDGSKKALDKLDASCERLESPGLQRVRQVMDRMKAMGEEALVKLHNYEETLQKLGVKAEVWIDNIGYGVGALGYKEVGGCWGVFIGHQPYSQADVTTQIIAAQYLDELAEKIAERLEQLVPPLRVK